MTHGGPGLKKPTSDFDASVRLIHVPGTHADQPAHGDLNPCFRPSIRRRAGINDISRRQAGGDLAQGIARNLLQFGPSSGLFGEVIVVRVFLFWCVALYGILFALRGLST
jgi:hypothetical protein